MVEERKSSQVEASAGWKRRREGRELLFSILRTWILSRNCWVGGHVYVDRNDCITLRRSMDTSDNAWTGATWVS